MAADERLMALKKAYADIILNTAKEAAMRIMASERKAQRFQRELQVGKDEALRMLLRLKLMMDTKIADAELMSLSQQKKIDELEAQLQEAEDIVKDLREELREVQSELEQLQNKQRHSDEQQALTQGGLSEQNDFHYTGSVAPPSNELEYVAAADSRNTCQYQTNESLKFYSAAPHMGNLYLGCPDLPSIILRSKEPELYRNGCTQRIRASEGNLLNREFSLSRQMSKDKDEISGREDITDREISEPSNRMGNLGKVLKKEVNNQVGILNPVPSFCTTKKRASRHRKKIFSSAASFPNQLSCSDRAHEISYIANYPTSVGRNTDYHVNPSSAWRLSLDKAESDLETGCGEASKNKKELAKSAGVHKPANGVREKSVPTMQKTTSADISVVSVGETNIEKADFLSPIPEPNGSALAMGFHSRPVNERVIKYTFQRKRKRESLSDFNAAVLLDMDESKRQILEKRNDPVEQEKLNLIESLQDSQRLAQVATQLISLSETMKW